MSSIIILEGIPTSGKTILQEKISQILLWEKRTIELIKDEEIKTPYNRKNNHKDMTPAKGTAIYFKELLQHKLLKKKQYLICDNAHLFYLATNNTRGAKETLKEYQEIETMLEVYPSLMVFLELENRYILPSFRKRIAYNELHHKVDPLKEFLDLKGSEFHQIAYYQKKQRAYQEFFKETKIHSLHIRIHQKPDYDEIANKIVRKIHEIEGGWHYKQ